MRKFYAYLLLALLATPLAMAQTSVNLPSGSGGATTVGNSTGDVDTRVRVDGNGDVRVGVSVDHNRDYTGIVTRGIEGAIDELGRGGDDVAEDAGRGAARGIRNLDVDSTTGKISRDVASRVVNDLARGRTGDIGDSALQQAARSGRSDFVSYCRNTIGNNSGGDRGFSRALGSSCSCVYSAASRGDSSRAQRCLERSAFNIIENSINGLLSGQQTCVFGFCFGGGGAGGGSYNPDGTEKRAELAGDAASSAPYSAVKEAARSSGASDEAIKEFSPAGTNVARASAPRVTEEQLTGEPTDEELNRQSVHRQRYLGTSLKHGYLATLSADSEEVEADYIEALLNTPKARVALTGTYLSPAMRATAESLKAEAQQDYQNILLRDQTIELAAGLGVEGARRVRRGINDCISQTLGDVAASAGDYARAYHSCSGAATGENYASFEGFEEGFVNSSGSGVGLGGGSGSGPSIRDVVSTDTIRGELILTNSSLSRVLAGNPAAAATLVDTVLIDGDAATDETSMPALAAVPITTASGTVAEPLPAGRAFEVTRQSVDFMARQMVEVARLFYGIALDSDNPRDTALALLELGEAAEGPLRDRPDSDVEASEVLGEGAGEWPGVTAVMGFADEQGCDFNTQVGLRNHSIYTLYDHARAQVEQVMSETQAANVIDNQLRGLITAAGVRPTTLVDPDSSEGGSSPGDVGGAFASGLALYDTALDCALAQGGRSYMNLLSPQYYIADSDNRFLGRNGFNEERALEHACRVADQVARIATLNALDYQIGRLSQLRAQLDENNDDTVSAGTVRALEAVSRQLEQDKQTIGSGVGERDCASGARSNDVPSGFIT